MSSFLGIKTILILNSAAFYLFPSFVFCNGGGGKNHSPTTQASLPKHVLPLCNLPLEPHLPCFLLRWSSLSSSETPPCYLLPNFVIKLPSHFFSFRRSIWTQLLSYVNSTGKHWGDVNAGNMAYDLWNNRNS